MSGEGTWQQRKKTKMLFQEIFSYTNLSLLWVNDGDGYVRIAFNDGIASQSQVGTDCLWVPKDHWTINLQSIRSDNECPSHIEERIIKHECMHLLAFVHEHQVPERPKHFLFDRSKVDEIYGRDRSKGGHGMSEEEIEINITGLCRPGELENYSPFDSKSITLYQFSYLLMQNGPGTALNLDLSDTDKAVLVLNYARLNPDPRFPEWTVCHAADVIGIKGKWREKIVSATRPHDIRILYSQWSTRAQRSQPKGDLEE